MKKSYKTLKKAIIVIILIINLLILQVKLWCKRLIMNRINILVHAQNYVSRSSCAANSFIINIKCNKRICFHFLTIFAEYIMGASESSQIYFSIFCKSIGCNNSSESINLQCILKQINGIFSMRNAMNIIFIGLPNLLCISK